MTIREQISSEEKKWYAIKCKFRCEKLILEYFISIGIEAYIPIQKRIRQYASRKKVSEVALINSHVFVKIDKSDYLTVLSHHYVFSFLSIGGIVNSIPEHEIDLLKRVVGEFSNIEISNAHYKEGDRVQILHGDLSGLQGVLVDQSNYNFKIELHSLGMGFVMEVDPRFLIRLNSQKQMVS